MARSPRLLVSLAAAAALVLAGGTMAIAAPGDLDPTFSADGIATTPIGTVDQAFAMTIDDAGRIVVAGSAFSRATNKDFAIVRYLSDGTLDTTFGLGGVVTTDFAGGIDQALDVAVDSAGRIVAVGGSAGGSGSDIAIARYLADGSPDAALDADGVITTDVAGGSDTAAAVAISDGDEIVVAGAAATASGSDFALARYDVGGALDPALDADGVVTTDFAADDDAAAALAIDATGAYVVAGSAGDGSGKDDFGVARYDSTGALDPTFGGDGLVVTPGTDQARDLAIDANGGIVVAGSDFTGTGLDFALIRYRDNGTIDTSFGTHGRVVTPIGTDSDGAEAVAIDAGGTIVAGGYATNGTDREFAVARYAPNGAPLAVFGGDGAIQTNVGPSDSGRDIAFDAHGNVVLAGYATTGRNADFAVLRYLGVGARADAMIKRPSELAYTGDGVINTDGAGQMRTAKGRRGGSLAFTYRLQNEGTAPDSFTLRGCADSPGFTVSYRQGASDITAAVQAGTYSLGPIAVGADATVSITIAVDPSAAIDASKTCAISASAGSDPSARDVVKAKVRVVG